jgi:hypothetical protein
MLFNVPGGKSSLGLPATVTYISRADMSQESKYRLLPLSFEIRIEGM